MALVIREQEDLGLDLLTDGEMRRTTFIFHIAGQWQGVDTQNVVTKKIYRNREANRLVPSIAGKIARRVPAAVDDLRAAKTHTSRPIKMAVPGPMTVIDSSSNEYYEDEEEFALDVAVALNGELRDLQAAGCAVLQIDEPAMTRYHDKVRAHGAYHRAAKRDVRKTAAGPAFDNAIDAHAGRDESALVILQLVVEEFLETLPPAHRQMVELRIEGYEVAEIAENVQRSKRSVERVLQDFRARLGAQIKED